MSAGPREAGLRRVGSTGLALLLSLGLAKAASFTVRDKTFAAAEDSDDRSPVPCLFLGYGVGTQTNWVRTIRPSDWGVRSEATNQTAVLVAPSLEATVRIQLLTTPQSLPDAADLPGWIRRQHLRGKTVRRLEPVRLLHASGVAEGFDVELADERSLGTGLRLAFVPIADGMALFELASAVTNVTNYYRAYGKIVSTFRPSKGPESNPLDELEAVRPPPP